ncbi:MAG TPA: terminase small subunit [Nitrosopumilaceae archaeon]|jgi:phage terminase small subunit|nr:terminase small subunit [Nitrosopumilaceae archaeon]
MAEKDKKETVKRILPDKLDKITDKQKAFVDEYLINGLNATKAYFSVYKGVKYSTAHSEAAVCLARPGVQAYFKSQQLEISKKGEISREYIVGHLKKLIADCTNDGDRLSLVKSLDMLCKIGGIYQTAPLVNVQSTGTVKVDFGGFSFDNSVKSIEEPIKDIEYTDVDDVNEDEESLEDLKDDSSESNLDDNDYSLPF